MPYFETSQKWVEQSSLLLQARPTTTRITTKYKVLPPSVTKSRKRKADSTDVDAALTNGTEQNLGPGSATLPAATPKGTLTLKSYDPVSGVCLKYRTDKAAEVGRLIASLGRLGRHMAALPDVAVVEDVVMNEAPDNLEASKETTNSTFAGKVDTPGTELKTAQGGPSAGGGKKKKKGKK